MLTRSAVRLAASVAVCLLTVVDLGAERLPIQAFTTADGLSHNVVNRIVRDSRGFMWFATNDGLSRFDGYGFQNYSVEAGLPHRTVMDVLETTKGEFWLATFGGLVRFRPSATPRLQVIADDAATNPPPMFTVIVPSDPDPQARMINTLLEARDGTIWCGARKGVFRLEQTAARSVLRPVDFGFPATVAFSQSITDLHEDRFGSIWAAAGTGLSRRWRDGAVSRYTREMPDVVVHHLYEDRKGQLWVSTRYGGFFRLGFDESRNAPAILEHHTARDGLPSTWVYGVLETSDHRFWVGTTVGLVEFRREATTASGRFRVFERRHGLTQQATNTLVEDAAGNLWMGTDTTGAMRLARQGFTTFHEPDGLDSAHRLFEDSTGALYAFASATRLATPAGWLPDANLPETRVQFAVLQFARVHDRRLEWFHPAPPFSFGCCGSGVIQSLNGEWWFAGDGGLFRFPASRDFKTSATGRVLKVYPDYGQWGTVVTAIFQDSRGDIWLGTITPKYGGLSRWNHATQTMNVLDDAPGLPPLSEELPRSFGEDAAGNVWMGLNTGVARYQHGSFTFFSTRDGLSAGRIVGIHTDRAGRLWLASTHGGLVRVDDCASERPRFVPFTVTEGLSGNVVEAITEDSYGRIYAATSRGIDRLDPETAAIEHFSVDDGLMPGTVHAAFRDRTGVLWFASTRGLARFRPEPKAPSKPPTILVSGLVVSGQQRPVSAVGETDILLPDLSHDGSQVEISYVALGARSTESIKYQYRLEGASGDWGPQTTRRTVAYASLAPGRYRFLVRAINPDGLTSTTPAAVTFTVRPPFWRTWWFLTLVAAAAAAATFGLHRYRVSRILELERVRSRIATDLHDDVGANLTRIAILSEVARQTAPADPDQREAKLTSIGSIARESVSAMSDIVWAISPERDSVQEMVRRMRHHTEDVFEGRDVTVRFDSPDEMPELKLGIDIRRDTYLIFKEAVNNAARHSSCTEIGILFRCSGQDLLLEVIDNGVGFDPATAEAGNGLTSMRRRAGRLGATLHITSTADVGTRVRLVMRVTS